MDEAIRKAGFQPSLFLDQVPIRVRGEELGLAISLGEGVTFFTTRPGLLHLDGLRFASIARLRARVEREWKGRHRLPNAV